MLEEETMTDDLFLQTVDKIWQNREAYVSAMNKSESSDAVGTIMRLIEEVSSAKKQKKHR